MNFARDPQDPTFHPIRDILDRPTLGQLRKLGLSAIMYATVILVGVGFAVYFHAYVWGPYQQLFPLRWNSRYAIRIYEIRELSSLTISLIDIR